MRLKDRVALVTGAGSGIGRATAILFASEGARVVASDVSEVDALETVKAITASGGEAAPVTGDVSDAGDAERMVKAAVDAYGRLDILVNSAGVSGRNALPQGASHEAIWDRVMDVNLKGTYLVSWYAVPEMERSGGGSIINLASIMGLVGYPEGMGGGFNPYVPSKGGVVQFTRNLAIDCAKKGIRVNCICPGYVETNLTRGLTENPEIKAKLEERHPMGRLGRPEEIASAALFLASDESSFMTGAPLIVDGGYTAQ
ncbi:MAG: SDR family oxidoreductase [Chloroflexi bacterium]|nr:SDR family oxidoreductase [Chloroflexota bacterium]